MPTASACRRRPRWGLCHPPRARGRRPPATGGPLPDTCRCTACAGRAAPGAGAAGGDAASVVRQSGRAGGDSRAEDEGFAALRGLVGGGEVLLIRDRLASRRSADRIYVRDEGRVVEKGRHAELMQLSRV